MNRRLHLKITEGEDVARAYSSWTEMRRRVRRPTKDRNNACYALVKITPRWDDFRLFLTDMGPCSEGLSIDRIDSKGDYTPDNCRWADSTTQARNRPGYVRLSISKAHEIREKYCAGGVTQSQLSDSYGVCQVMISKVLRGESWL